MLCFVTTRVGGQQNSVSTAKATNNPGIHHSSSWYKLHTDNGRKNTMLAQQTACMALVGLNISAFPSRMAFSEEPWKRINRTSEITIAVVKTDLVISSMNPSI